MSDVQNVKSGHIEINDLINESVANAVERRNLALAATGFLSELSDTEINNIIGGGDYPICTPTTMGYAQNPTNSIDRIKISER